LSENGKERNETSITSTCFAVPYSAAASRSCAFNIPELRLTVKHRVQKRDKIITRAPFHGQQTLLRRRSSHNCPRRQLPRRDKRTPQERTLPELEVSKPLWCSPIRTLNVTGGTIYLSAKLEQG
jgi:ribosome modulation factor